MKKAIVAVLALSIPVVATAASGEREFERGQLGVNARTLMSDLRANDDRASESRARNLERKVSFEFSRSRDFLAGRAAESGRSEAPRALGNQHAVAPIGVVHSAAVAAPEIDPTSAVSGLTLLLGGIAVLRGRKARAV